MTWRWKSCHFRKGTGRYNGWSATQMHNSTFRVVPSRCFCCFQAFNFTRNSGLIGSNRPVWKQPVTPWPQWGLHCDHHPGWPRGRGVCRPIWHQGLSHEFMIRFSFELVLCHVICNLVLLSLIFFILCVCVCVCVCFGQAIVSWLPKMMVTFQNSGPIQVLHQWKMVRKHQKRYNKW